MPRRFGVVSSRDCDLDNFIWVFSGVKGAGDRLEMILRHAAGGWPDDESRPPTALLASAGAIRPTIRFGDYRCFSEAAGTTARRDRRADVDLLVRAWKK